MISILTNAMSSCKCYSCGRKLAVGEEVIETIYEGRITDTLCLKCKLGKLELEVFIDMDAQTEANGIGQW